MKTIKQTARNKEQGASGSKHGFLFIAHCSLFSCSRDKGFTLLEVLIYVAIVVFMLASAFTVVNNILESQERSAINIEVFDNAHFVMRKLAWALDDAASITSPAANATGTTLSITKASSTENPFLFSLASNEARLSTGGGTAFPLTSSRVLVDEMTFRHVDPTYGPSSVRITLRISSVPKVGLTTYTASTTLETSIFLNN